jgi:uncharacterized protein involved in exopolysaccharide biosynthesis
VSGNANIAGDISIMGRSLSAWMAQMDERLGILQINPELQAEFTELQALATQYRQLEAQLHQKMQTWQILKD